MKINLAKLKRLEEKALQARAAFDDVRERHREAKSNLDRYSLEVKSSILRATNGHAIWNEIQAHWPEVDLRVMSPVFAPQYGKENESDEVRWKRSIVFGELSEIDQMRAEVERLEQASEAARELWSNRNSCLPALRGFAEQAGQTGGL
ncbi:hypothetical protein SAMN02949497_3241 [Methylomagnum ishizawai]|uniref:Uncharacterized protein n=1 Tax=Methylomagnum ishizawai TaxID=1760988 RepID=A0A1Y6D7Q2_9GAMM|nr:hypothetical protein [Methylomagnum ishizawai]SMF95865.1 hypothetical protein SAMN02949497_3241 [Methylomagnum ishizawai]